MHKLVGMSWGCNWFVRCFLLSMVVITDSSFWPLNRLGRISMIIWEIWSARILKIWQDKVVTAQQTIQLSALQVTQWRESQQRVQSNGRVCGYHTLVGDIIWKPPREGWLEVNVDAHIIPGCNWFSCGFVLRDHMGHFIRAFTRKFAGKISVVKA